MQRLTKSALLEAYPVVRKIVGDYLVNQLPTCPQRATEWVEKVLDYNVPHGKLTRGLTVVHAYQYLKPQASESDINVAVKLAWALELLQACFLVADDIMDSSLTRRGRPCWYKVSNVGMNAVNDSLLLENSVYVLLKNSLADEKLRNSILSIIAEAKLNTLLGQHLDSEWTPLHACTNEHYSNVVRLKTSHYSFYLPLALALTLRLRPMAAFGTLGHLAQAGENIQNAPNELQRLCYDMGYYFQVQDDYLDCFGDPTVTGKVGTDIQDGKCTWLLINALDSVQRNGDDWKMLEANYGKSESSHVDAVKTLYARLGLERKYENFESEIFKVLKDQIDNFPISSLRVLFIELLQELHQRKK